MSTSVAAARRNGRPMASKRHAPHNPSLPSVVLAPNLDLKSEYDEMSSGSVAHARNLTKHRLVETGVKAELKLESTP